METNYKSVTTSNNVVSCISLQSNENYIKDNSLSYACKSLSSKIQKNTLYSSENNFTSVDQISKSFNNLNIQSCTAHSEDSTEHPAGVISNIIKSLYVVLVKPYSPGNLLYFGTPLFLNIGNFQNCESKFMLLGYIEDIFGSIGEPMYSVTVNCDLISALNIHAQVYYFPNNSSTSHMSVEYKVDNGSNKKKYNISIHNV